MQLAEVLGIAAEDVRPLVGDTDSVGYTSMTGGSSVAFKTGWASYEAALDIRQQMIERAARIWDVSPDLVGYDNGVISHKSDPELKLTFKELAARLNGTGGPVTGRGNVSPAGVGGAFAVHIVDVEVDPDTGKVDIVRYTAVQDVGKAVHPSYVEGQIQGGAVQGIGWALNEEYVFDNQGGMQNPTFLDYRMPISLDLPMIDTVIVEVPNPGHPYGVRGVGRSAHSPANGGHRQRHPRRRRRQDGPATDVSRRGVGSPLGERLTVRSRNRRNLLETGRTINWPVSGNQEEAHGFDQSQPGQAETSKQPIGDHYPPGCRTATS